MTMRDQIAEIIVKHWCLKTGNIDQVVMADAILAALPDHEKQQARIAELEAALQWVKDDAKKSNDAPMFYRVDRALKAKLEAALTEIACFEPANPFEDMECQAMARAALKAKP
jgi:hypothetical protein